MITILLVSVMVILLRVDWEKIIPVEGEKIQPKKIVKELLKEFNFLKYLKNRIY